MCRYKFIIVISIDFTVVSGVVKIILNNFLLVCLFLFYLCVNKTVKMNTVKKKTKKETKQQRSVSILPSKLKRVEKLYGSLTKYVDAKLLSDNI